MPRLIVRLLAIAAVVLVGLGMVGPAAPSAAPPADHTEDRVEAAAWWSRTEVDRIADAVASGAGVDVGLALDHLLALLALGRERGSVDRALTAIEPRIRDYVALNPAAPVSGHLAKTLFTAVATGRPTTYGGVDLAGELRANMVTEGTRTGEFPHYRGASSGQTFFQSWSIMALARTGGAPPEAVDWLLRSQCPTGGFPSAVPTGPVDACPRGGHVDSTAMAIQALQVAPRTTATATAIDRAADWLMSVQAGDGGFSDNDRAPKNTNSTGLASQALRAAGRTAAADRARAWVEGRQILCDGAAAHRGAFTYSVPGDVPGGDGPRANPQAVLALGLAPYGAIGGGGSAPARPLWCPVDDGDDDGGGDDDGDDGGGDDEDDGSDDDNDPEEPDRPGGDGDGTGTGTGTGTGGPGRTGTGGAGGDAGGDGSGGARGSTDPDAPRGLADSLRQDQGPDGPEDEAGANPGDDAGDDVRAMTDRAAGESEQATAAPGRAASVRDASRPRGLVPVTAAAAALALVAVTGVRSGTAGRAKRKAALATSTASPARGEAAAGVEGTAAATGTEAGSSTGTGSVSTGSPPPDDTDDLPNYG